MTSHELEFHCSAVHEVVKSTPSLWWIRDPLILHSLKKRTIVLNSESSPISPSEFQNIAHKVMMSTPETVKDLKDPKSSIDSVIEEYQSTGFPDKRSHRYFSYLSSLYLILLSLPLLAFPRFLVMLLGPWLVNKEDSPDDLGIIGAYRPLNQLGTYLSRLVGLSFLTLASLIVLQTGAIPVSSSMVHGSDTTSNTAPYRQPTIFFSTLFFSLLGFSSWNVGLKAVGAPGLALGAGGLWILLFAGDPVAHGKKSHAIFGDSK
ncbi:hypothetical protein Pst134EB_020194 [Puccinia striiformis f. sp. tritici]|nr:hypothetical protein Pst134EB_020194 [Puccinia striiformis f. sp. tritici]